MLYAWQAFFVPRSPKPAPAPTALERAGRSTPDRTVAEPAAHRPSVAAEPRPRQHARRLQPLVAEQSERDIRVETDDVIAVFTNRGARLKSWRLKHYQDQQGQPLELVDD